MVKSAGGGGGAPGAVVSTASGEGVLKKVDVVEGLGDLGVLSLGVALGIAASVGLEILSRSVVGLGASSPTAHAPKARTRNR